MVFFHTRICQSFRWYSHLYYSLLESCWYLVLCFCEASQFLISLFQHIDIRHIHLDSRLKSSVGMASSWCDMTCLKLSCIELFCTEYHIPTFKHMLLLADHAILVLTLDVLLNAAASTTVVNYEPAHFCISKVLKQNQKNYTLLGDLSYIKS